MAVRERERERKEGESSKSVEKKADPKRWSELELIFLPEKKQGKCDTGAIECNYNLCRNTVRHQEKYV